MARHRTKIAVIVEQWLAVLDAPGADQQVDSLADGNPTAVQRAEIARRRDGNRVASHGYDFEVAQQCLDFLRLSLAVQTLQHSQSIRSPTVISSVPRTARNRRTWDALGH